MSEEEPTPTDPPAKETDWKAEARKWEERAKANKSTADELQQRVSELEPVAARVPDLESKAGELAEKVQTFESERERTELVSTVAKEQEVPADALRGATREELETHAEILKAHLKVSGPTIPGQEQLPEKGADDPMRELARGLFADKE